MSNQKEKSVVVLQLSGGNDYLNTIVPYGDSAYYDFRKSVHIEQDAVLPIDNMYGFNPNLRPIKELFDDHGPITIKCSSKCSKLNTLWIWIWCSVCSIKSYIKCFFWYGNFTTI